MMRANIFSPHRRALLLAAALALVPSVAQGCAKDGVPSVSANGHLAVLNRPSGRLSPTSWTLFVFARPVQHGHAVTLSENNREVAQALPKEAFAHPWRWDFGDRSRPGYGTSVRHTYRKPGTYRIGVWAYYASYGVWEQFDNVTIHIT